MEETGIFKLSKRSVTFRNCEVTKNMTTCTVVNSRKCKGHDVNNGKFITIPILLRYLQEASLQHARNLKASVWDMTEDQLSWVLVRKSIKIVKSLKLDNTYSIITYPSGFDKFMAYRDYLVFDEDKKRSCCQS